MLHECAISERQTLLERVRRTGACDEFIENKEGKTAR